MSEIDADISLLISRLSDMAAGFAVGCRVKVGFSRDGLGLSNDCTGLNGFLVDGGLNDVG